MTTVGSSIQRCSLQRCTVFCLELAAQPNIFGGCAQYYTATTLERFQTVYIIRCSSAYQPAAECHTVVSDCVFASLVGSSDQPRTSYCRANSICVKCCQHQWCARCWFIIVSQVWPGRDSVRFKGLMDVSVKILLTSALVRESDDWLRRQLRYARVLRTCIAAHHAQVVVMLCMHCLSMHRTCGSNHWISSEEVLAPCCV
jgi:hypothetical protein